MTHLYCVISSNDYLWKIRSWNEHYDWLYNYEEVQKNQIIRFKVSETVNSKSKPERKWRLRDYRNYILIWVILWDWKHVNKWIIQRKTVKRKQTNQKEPKSVGWLRIISQSPLVCCILTKTCIQSQIYCTYLLSMFKYAGDLWTSIESSKVQMSAKNLKIDYFESEKIL